MKSLSFTHAKINLYNAVLLKQRLIVGRRLKILVHLSRSHFYSTRSVIYQRQVRGNIFNPNNSEGGEVFSIVRGGGGGGGFHRIPKLSAISIRTFQNAPYAASLHNY